jgi:hypothetical protein
MRILVSLLAWFLGQTVAPNRAGRLVPLADDGMEPSFLRSLLAHWALWGAVGLILLALAAGYLRRRWKVRRGQRSARFVEDGRGRGKGRD